MNILYFNSGFILIVRSNFIVNSRAWWFCDEPLVREIGQSLPTFMT